MHDREGETYYTDVFTGEKKATSMWMRHIGGHNRWKDSSSQLNTQSNRYVVQLGGSIAQWTDGQDRLQLGIMAGYGNEKSSTTSSLSGYKSKGAINGYSTGLYGTWQQNDGNDNGAYVDTGSSTDGLIIPLMVKNWLRSLEIPWIYRFSGSGLYL